MADAVTASTALVAVGAAAVVLALALLAVLVRSRRRARGSDREMIELVSEMNARMEGMVRELSEALERAQEEGRRNRFFGALGTSIDLDEVLSRTLEAGGAIPGVDAALVSVRDGDGKPIVPDSPGTGTASPECTSSVASSEGGYW